jgi:hypothetical protein
MSARFASLASVLALSAVACSSSSGSTAESDSPNLIQNPGAEAAIGSSSGAPVKTPDWTSTGGATALQYGAPSYPSSTDPGSPTRGKNFFAGGEADATSSLSQTIDVSQYATSIDTGDVKYALSGWLGGYSDQEDNAALTITFKSSAGSALGKGSIGPVTATERADTTEFLEKSSTGSVPANTRTVVVLLTMVRDQGTADDGYADDLSLVFDGI